MLHVDKAQGTTLTLLFTRPSQRTSNRWTLAGHASGRVVCDSRSLAGKLHALAQHLTPRLLASAPRSSCHICLTCAARDRRPAMIEQRRTATTPPCTSTDGEQAVKADTSIIKDKLRREGALPGATRNVLYLNTLCGVRPLHPGGFPPTFVEGARKPLLRTRSLSTLACASRRSHVRCVASPSSHAHKHM